MNHVSTDAYAFGDPLNDQRMNSFGHFITSIP